MIYLVTKLLSDTGNQLMKCAKLRVHGGDSSKPDLDVILPPETLDRAGWYPSLYSGNGDPMINGFNYNGILPFEVGDCFIILNEEERQSGKSTEFIQQYSQQISYIKSLRILEELIERCNVEES